jgi:hypothetical protein
VWACSRELGQAPEEPWQTEKIIKKTRSKKEKMEEGETQRRRKNEIQAKKQK